MKNAYPKIITIGEALVDFVPEGLFYSLKPGGAPANVAVNLARLGVSAALIGKTGDDALGLFLKLFLKSQKVDIRCFKIQKNSKTGLVFVSLDKNGERDFSFYGEKSADKYLSVKDIDNNFIKNCRILHFGSISMMSAVSKKAVLKAIKLAKTYAKIISFDPNVRLNLWNSPAKAKQNIKQYFKYADIIKISDDELKFLFNITPQEVVRKSPFKERQIVFISCGDKGCYVSRQKQFFYVPAIKVKAVDTTGAGDAFMAGILAGVQDKGMADNFETADLINAAKLGNKLGAHRVTVKGAV